MDVNPPELCAAVAHVGRRRLEGIRVCVVVCQPSLDAIAPEGGVLDMAQKVTDSDHWPRVALEHDHRQHAKDPVDSPPRKPELSKIGPIEKRIRIGQTILKW
jgi:hypothetical protein